MFSYHKDKFKVYWLVFFVQTIVSKFTCCIIVAKVQIELDISDMFFMIFSVFFIKKTVCCEYTQCNQITC